jgi:hypothetical protein
MVFNEKSSAQSIKMGVFHYFQVNTHIAKKPNFCLKYISSMCLLENLI